MSTGMSHAQGELLAQIAPGVTTALTLFTAGNLRVEVTLIMACVVGAGTIDTTLYHDVDGTTYAVGNMIKKQQLAEWGESIVFQAQHPGSGIFLRPGDSIGVQIGTVDKVTFSLYGITETLAERIRGLSNG